MARTWLQIKVELLGGLDIECDPPPGRVFAVSPSLSFERLAEAINVSFGRWDLSHLHVFELADGRRIGFPDVGPEEHGWVDHAGVKIGSALKPGDEFGFTFDFGDDWRHRCLVLDQKVDAREEFGELPRGPVTLWGWGWLPDQYGRATGDEVGLGPAEHALADHRAAELHEGLVQFGAPLVTGPQSPKVV